MATSHVERIELDGLTCWRVRHADAELLIAQQGAQLLSYQRDNQPPLIWLSEQAAYQRGQSVRGGVPVCWPWFGDLQRNPAAVQAMHRQPTQAPAHGLVRGIDWQLRGIDSQDDGVNLEFTYNSTEQALPDWPHAAELSLRIRLDSHLNLDLCSRNLGTTALAISQALHSYFAVSDIRQVHVEGLEGCRYIETLENWQTRQQSGPLGFQGETDRIYLETPAHMSILDPAWQRRILLRSSGSGSAVLWNPWIAKAQRLSQFADTAWQRMLCIEHANVLDDTLLLAPGSQHTLSVSLWSEPVLN
ncbi:D-hexose-6-phosphate mutarotase [Pseudomonas sp. UBA2684]|uniref:D-hexose-6-phosphate mutarotase n=1 Tax=Pseudomonas sp. UBA2684 TaxID=1947311 RepID=UPI000E9CB782|nr:D-hexose-6-phosphate mutarotase [Pseudomonas sp. UBA2684]HBX56695.1 D-hexose-6-phosphate mutarotase [Pseudomonas sp.]|tara:strand:- start:13898 stop:14803 length:906 start_codon:yes stop_codon:yes gene_type:complete